MEKPTCKGNLGKGERATPTEQRTLKIHGKEKQIKKYEGTIRPNSYPSFIAKSNSIEIAVLISNKITNSSFINRKHL